MPRTTYSDFSLPNLSQDLEPEKRCFFKRKMLGRKKKHKNMVRTNRKKVQRSKRRLKRTFIYKRSFSPQYKIQIYDEDSASFQSDCIDGRTQQECPFAANESAIPFLLLQKDGDDRLREECQRRELVKIMRECCLGEESEMGE